jgi:hypothetical protein
MLLKRLVIHQPRFPQPLYSSHHRQTQRLHSFHHDVCML